MFFFSLVATKFDKREYLLPWNNTQEQIARQGAFDTKPEKMH